MNKFLAIAAAAIVGMGSMAMAANNQTVSVPVKINVQPFIEVTVLDAAGVSWDVIGTGATSTTDMGVSNGTHAKFKVVANQQYDLTMLSSNGTFEAASLPAPYNTYKQVKFLATDNTHYIGGSLYLRPVSSTGSAQSFQYWNGTTGSIALSAQAAGIYVWGVACGAAPQLNNFANGVAPVDTYSTNAQITATLNP